MRNIIITENEADQRLDKFLKKYLPKAPLSHVYKLIRKDVKVNGKRVSQEFILNHFDEVSLYIDDNDFEELSKKNEIKKAKQQFAVVYEDDNIIVVDKPKGLLIHGDHLEKKNTLTNQVIDYLVQKGDFVPAKEKTFIPAPVNRLDRNTSGLVIFGKNYGTVKALNKMIKEQNCIEKYYYAICTGELHESKTLVSYIKRDEKSNKTIIITDISSKDGFERSTYNAGQTEFKRMETFIAPIETIKGYSLIEVKLITGRTHQIRAHLANEGMPIVGDVKYKGQRDSKTATSKNSNNQQSSQMLHAYKIVFRRCEETLEYLEGKEIKGKLPKDFTDYWDAVN